MQNTFEPRLGESIDSAFARATNLANRLKIDIEFRFNGKECVASPDHNPECGNIKLKPTYQYTQEDGQVLSNCLRERRNIPKRFEV